jgi:hypothetical protein
MLQHLLHKQEALSSNSCTTKKNLFFLASVEGISNYEPTTNYITITANPLELYQLPQALKVPMKFLSY